MSGYIQAMRALVGRRPILQCGASVLVRNAKGELLLQQRMDNGLWGYHGGSVELDERVEDAARRELLEETGLTAKRMTLLGVFSGPELHYIYPNGDEVSNIDIVFLCDDYTGEITRQPDEVRALRWFAPGELPPFSQITPPNRAPLRAYLSSLEERNVGAVEHQARG